MQEALNRITVIWGAARAVLLGRLWVQSLEVVQGSRRCVRQQVVRVAAELVQLPLLDRRVFLPKQEGLLGGPYLRKFWAADDRLARRRTVEQQAVPQQESSVLQKLAVLPLPASLRKALLLVTRVFLLLQMRCVLTLRTCTKRSLRSQVDASWAGMISRKYTAA